jgi:hypothetical protein
MILASLSFSGAFSLGRLLRFRLRWTAKGQRYTVQIAPHPCCCRNEHVEMHGGASPVKQPLIVGLEVVRPAIRLEEG